MRLPLKTRHPDSISLDRNGVRAAIKPAIEKSPIGPEFVKSNYAEIEKARKSLE